MQIDIKKLNPYAIIPTRGSDYAAGYDLYVAAPSNEEIVIEPHKKVLIETGIAMSIPTVCFGAIFARSGLAHKEGLRPSNCVGVIDSDYTGEIKVSLYNDSDYIRAVRGGERIAQLVILPYVQADFYEVDDLVETKRGDGGFGSTDQIPGQMSIEDFGIT